ncbi:hypothetical protein [Ulvibacter litoralis]|uniref:Lipocalin-like domain-containing protein n=1 Tax=Ulvibacter litoralis TaxID=227084 RepID=A0A1G7CJ44_9FLAO|nr:hypothetical protein [Ulvibacter litoralis]GHC47160.1 hypothetical protein GCM10008083_07880 [Ulvibacter litoralis]SDE39347.1 hypothetical protein SAMN05421855_101407 [Ulvibacter litoralis]
MKTLKPHKVIFLLFVLLSVLSCKTEDDKTPLSDNLIGEWQRSDVTTEFEYKLVFDTENMGYSAVREGDLAGQSTSTALGFEWNTEDTTLIMDYGDEVVRTSFSINENGELLLSDITNLVFIKL